MLTFPFPSKQIQAQTKKLSSIKQRKREFVISHKLSLCKQGDKKCGHKTETDGMAPNGVFYFLILTKLEKNRMKKSIFNNRFLFN